MRTPFARAARIAVAALVPSVLIAASGLTGAASAVAPVTCGATVKSNAVLTANLTCAAGNGITLYRGVTLDLGGHTLTGPGSGVGVTLSFKGGSSVINGRISNWADGVFQDGSDNVDANPAPGRISKVTFTSAGVDTYLADLTIASSTFTNSPVGFLYGDITATGSTFTKSSVTGSAGLVTVSGSTVVGGTVASGDSRGVQITTSTLDGTGYTGSFTGCFQSPITITKSTVKNYSEPILPSQCSTTLTGNVFSNNRNGVFRLYATDGSSGDATISGNTFTGNGIAVEGVDFLSITGNTFRTNATGVLIRSPKEFGELGSDTNSVVSGNIFDRNTSSGLVSTATALGVGSNTATNNGRYGLNVAKARDLGGNIASGNKLGNCIGVRCAAK